MPSFLTFEASDEFRKRLMKRNLEPYSVDGVYSPNISSVNYEVNIRDIGVYDSPDDLISDSPFSEVLYVYNQYGPTGGYDKDNVGNFQIVNERGSNEGEYGYSNASLVEDSELYQSTISTQNRYSFPDINVIQLGKVSLVPTNQPYLPINFVCSSYSPYNVLIQNDPQGSNGRVSEDSYIIQLGIKELKNSFQNRIDAEIYQNTIGRANILDAISDPVKAIQILSGKLPLVERDWVITRPSNLLYNALDFTARLGGAYIPSSLIQGDYFDDVTANNTTVFSQISASVRRLTRNKNRSGSQLFLDNTGSAQKSQLFYNVSFNKYIPQYKELVTDNPVTNIISRLYSLFDKPESGNYYIGSESFDISDINGPSGDLPLDSNGNEIDSIVYGPSEISKSFEGDQSEFISYGKSYQDNSDVTGGFVWKDSKSQAGRNYLIGGAEGSEDGTFEDTKSKIEGRSSDVLDFKDGSILDSTNRLVQSTPKDTSRRLRHVGNAINNVSKVFNDGYKEITKGSRVTNYVWTKENGYIAGKEYCRLFTKDTPYLQFSDLQKKDGNIRKLEYSVLDSTYNLNIVPYKGVDSTNIKDGKVTKYMFSIENLAWRTSSRPDVNYDALPECERGPNGGRIMWFPPYDIAISENSRSDWNTTDFLGRVEPIYTYKNTTRTGTLKWKIIVDHPSVMNLVADKTMNGLSDEEINNIFDSFFAGCLKYDLYELAKKYNTIPPDKLREIQRELKTTPRTIDDSKKIKREYTEIETIPENERPDLSEFVGLGFYFDNDVPSPDTITYSQIYDQYISKLSSIGGVAQTFSISIVESNKNYLDKTLVSKITEVLDKGYVVKLNFVGSASAPASQEYNRRLSKRRVESILLYLKENPVLSQYIDDKKLIIDTEFVGETATVTPKGFGGGGKLFGSFGTVVCGPDDKPKHYNNYDYNLMACRRVAISNIQVLGQVTREVTREEEIIDKKLKTEFITTENIQTSRKSNISKRILQSLLTECNYFEYLREGDPMVYNKLKDKFKHFHPAFHSITPEGLNSRLTFLQQCTRPGDTIPVVNRDGSLKYNDAKNSAFGAPPVLVLRFGDFWHSKIIPTGGIDIQYEPLVLDLNPEGIGIQPMIATITMNFAFVGGQGLKEPVDKLQNALSFNFYANTEMFDERSEVTDTSLEKFDEELFDYISGEKSGSENDIDNDIINNNGNTIGTISNKFIDDFNITRGTLDYRDVVDGFISDLKTYIESVESYTNTIVSEYNLATLNLLFANRNYSKGVVSYYNTSIQKKIRLFGKPDYVNNINTSFDSLISYIQNDDLTFLKSIKKKLKNKDSVYNMFKVNLINYVLQYKNNFSVLITENINKIVETQTNLIKSMESLDVIMFGVDGFRNNKQETIVYQLDTTTKGFSDTKDSYLSAVELVDDFYDYYVKYENNSFSKKFNLSNLQVSAKYFKTDEDKLFYMILSSIFRKGINNSLYGEFKDFVLNRVGSIKVNGVTFERIYDDNILPVLNATTAQHNQEDSAAIDNYKKFDTNTLNTDALNFDVEFSDSPDATENQITSINNYMLDGNWLMDKTLYNGKHKLN